MSWNLRRFPLVVATGLLLVIGACLDTQPTGPEHAADALADSVRMVAPDAPDELLSGLLRLTGSSSDHPQLEVLRRTERLESDETASARVGLLGATLHLPRAGLTVHVPAGAARPGTRITVTAPAGDLVGYHFEPHGLKFSLPVTVTQSLLGTEASSDLVQPTVAGYFQGELTPVVSALEVLPLRLVGGLTGSAIFTISHFSGYIVATN